MKEFKKGFLCALSLVVWSFIILFPARWVLALERESFKIPKWEYLTSSMGLDFWRIFPYLAGIFLFLLVLRSSTYNKFMSRFTRGLFAFAFFVVWLWTLSCTEFKLQRGAYPTPFDAANGLEWGFIKSNLFFFFTSPHYMYPSIAGLFAAIIFDTKIKPAKRLRSVPSYFGFVLVSTLSVVLGFQIYVHSFELFPSIDDRGLVETPIDFFQPRGDRYKNAQDLILKWEGNEDDSLGARRMGFNPQWRENLTSRCEEHPLKRPFDETYPLNVQNELVNKLDELSRLLMAERKKLHVWQLVLEGFRTTDINALWPTAPRELTPFVSSLIEDPINISAHEMLTPGPRSAQGFSAAHCGTGTFPYALGQAREFSNMPLRCIPDIFKDAGAFLNFAFGVSLRFDNKLEFISYHGFDTKIGQDNIPVTSPKQEWTYTDKSVLNAAFEQFDFDKTPLTYNVWVSVSNHAPYDVPPDAPADVIARAEAALSKRKVGDMGMEQGRILTFTYTDHAVEHFFEKLKEKNLAQDSLVFVVADHAIGNVNLWDEHVNSVATYTRIPFVVVLNPEFQKTIKEKAKVKKVIDEINSILKILPLSGNDVPKIVLQLTRRFETIEALPEAWKWHTFGGTATSPYYPHEEGVYGINSVSELFVHKDGELQALNARVIPPSMGDYEKEGNSYLRPIGSFLYQFFENYGTRCESPKNIRKEL